MSTWRILRPNTPPQLFRGTLAEAKELVEADGSVLSVREAGWREFRPEPGNEGRVFHVFIVRDSRGRFVYTVNLVREQS